MTSTHINPFRSNTSRDSTALIVTIGIHAGVAALALLAVTASTPDRPHPPLVTHAIPEPGPTPPPAPDIKITDLPVAVALPVPTIETQQPSSETWLLTPADQPVIRVPDPAPIPRTDPGLTAPTGPTGPTVSARLDPRYAAAAQPPYPSAAQRLGEEGAVVVHVRISTDGRVLAATIAQGSGSPRLDAAAIAHALKRWRFTPALNKGTAVEAERDITVTFRLADARG